MWAKESEHSPSQGPQNTFSKAIEKAQSIESDEGAEKAPTPVAPPSIPAPIPKRPDIAVANLIMTSGRVGFAKLRVAK